MRVILPQKTCVRPYSVQCQTISRSEETIRQKRNPLFFPKDFQSDLLWRAIQKIGWFPRQKETKQFDWRQVDLCCWILPVKWIRSLVCRSRRVRMRQRLAAWCNTTCEIKWLESSSYCLPRFAPATHPPLTLNGWTSRQAGHNVLLLLGKACHSLLSTRAVWFASLSFTLHLFFFFMATRKLRTFKMKPSGQGFCDSDVVIRKPANLGPLILTLHRLIKLIRVTG